MHVWHVKKAEKNDNIFHMYGFTNIIICIPVLIFVKHLPLESSNAAIARFFYLTYVCFIIKNELYFIYSYIISK